MPLNDVLTLSGLPELDALRAVYCLALAGHINRAAWPERLKLVKATKSTVPKSPVEPPKPTRPLPSEDEDLAGFLARIENAVDHYGVLDVENTTPVDDIKRAYYGLARRYHPDRFHQDSTVHARIESAFARITQAYEVLTDGTQRTSYDAKLAAQDKARHIANTAPKGRGQQTNETTGGVAQEPDFAERSFREGYAALQTGQLNVAITQLSAAAHADPRESRYRAYYGQALAADGRSQRLAESELQAAIRLEPRNPSYHVMLAQLYYDLSFSHRAQGEVERALQLDPDNASAQTLLRKLEKK